MASRNHRQKLAVMGSDFDNKVGNMESQFTQVCAIDAGVGNTAADRTLVGHDGHLENPDEVQDQSGASAWSEAGGEAKYECILDSCGITGHNLRGCHTRAC
jgi:hypothetical protein